MDLIVGNAAPKRAVTFDGLVSSGDRQSAYCAVCNSVKELTREGFENRDKLILWAPILMELNCCQTQYEPDKKFGFTSQALVNCEQRQQSKCSTM
jgi:hypothetical protein